MRQVLFAAAAAAVMIPGLLAAQTVVAPAKPPAVIGQLGLTEVEYRRYNDHGLNVIGRLPEGSWIEVELSRSDEVEEIEAEGRGGFPAAAVAALIPAPVRENAAYPADGTFDKVDFESGGRMEIEGTDRNGHRFEAEFAANGSLVEMKIKK